jgi:hypothetical protein
MNPVMSWFDPGRSNQRAGDHNQDNGKPERRTGHSGSSSLDIRRYVECAVFRPGSDTLSTKSFTRCGSLGPTFRATSA